MTNITIKRNSETPEITISIKGHSGYANQGSDIVCAGVSALMNTTILGLQQIEKEFPSYVRINMQEDE